MIPAALLVALVAVAGPDAAGRAVPSPGAEVEARAETGGEGHATSRSAASPAAGAAPASPGADSRNAWALFLAGGSERLGLPGFPVQSFALRGGLLAPAMGGGVLRGLRLELGVEGFRSARTGAGLRLSDFNASALLWWSPARLVAVGGGLSAGYVGFERATTGEMAWGNTFGLVLGVDADPVRWRSGSLFVRGAGQLRAARGEHGWVMPTTFSLLAGIRLGLGVPSRVVRRPGEAVGREPVVARAAEPTAETGAAASAAATPRVEATAVAAAAPERSGDASAAASAREPALSAPTEPPFCYRGRPRPECRAYVLTEVDVSGRLAGTASWGERGTDVPHDRTLAFNLGSMVNLDARHAIGGALVVAYTDVGEGVGLSARYRYWWRRRTALDAGAGVLRAYVGSDMSGRSVYGNVYDLSVALNLADALALSAHAQATRLPSGAWDVGVYPGIRAGSWVAVIGTVTAFVALMALMAGTS